MPPRVGSVTYLNALPLVEGLEAELGQPLYLAPPARIADQLAAGALDLGLVPVAEAARQRLWAVPGPAVAARAAVRSVLLVARGPLPEVKRLALDPTSRSSILLAQLLLAEVHGLRPELVAAPAEGHPLPAAADAAVVIGDRALSGNFAGLTVIDLARWWIEWTALPFVFALWAGPDPGLCRSLAPALGRARARGLESLGAIAEREGPPRGLARELATSYLREAIHFDAGELELRGLELFLSLARAARLLPGDAALRLLPVPDPQA